MNELTIYNTEGLINRELANQLESTIISEVTHACTNIMHAENHDIMLYHYWGINYFLDIMRYSIFDMNSEYKVFFEERETQIILAHNYYYDNAKKDFENAHKRLF